MNEIAKRCREAQAVGAMGELLRDAASEIDRLERLPLGKIEANSVYDRARGMRVLGCLETAPNPFAAGVLQCILNAGHEGAHRCGNGSTFEDIHVANGFRNDERVR